MSPAISVRATPSQNSKRSICKFAYLFNFQTNMDSGAGLHNWKLKFGIDCMAGYFFFAKIHQRKTAFPRNRWLVAGDEQFQCHPWGTISNQRDLRGTASVSASQRAANACGGGITSRPSRSRVHVTTLPCFTEIKALTNRIRQRPSSPSSPIDQRFPQSRG